MQYQILILFITTILNTIFSYFIIRGEKKPSNLLFSLINLAIALWAINLSFFITTSDLNNALIFANSYYLAAAAIPMLFFYFSLFFPENKERFKKEHIFFVIPFLILLFAMLVDKNLIIKEIYYASWGKDVVLNNINYLIYVLYFLFFVIVSYYYLVKLYDLNLDKIEKKQLKFLIIGTSLSYLFGMMFNLFLPYLGNYQYIWLGPLFTLIMVFSLGYATLKHHLFNIKTIATEILTFSLWIFIFIRMLLSSDLNDKLLNGGLLAITVVVGILLIRSVYKEVETREKIELLAKDLEKANARLKELDQQKSEFVSIASHQLRSPLTAIKGYASMITEGSFGEVGPKAMEAVNRIFESSKHLAAVVEDLLNVTKIEQGGMKYEFTKVDFKKLVQDIISDLLPNAQNKGLPITYGDNGHKTYFVSADYEKIRQVILNLIDNAMKYTPKGEIDVFLNEDDKEGKIKLSVKDNGVGVSDELKNRLFEKFSRGDGISKINTGGSGLGLYVAKEIVEAHKGRIWVESPGEGKGSTFFVEMNEYNYSKESDRVNNFAEKL